MNRIFLLATMFALSAPAAFAEIDTDGLIGRFQDDGYTTIEVTRGLTQTKVEAINQDSKVEVVFDNASGQVLDQEFDTPEADDDTQPGVTVRDRNRDFVDSGDQEDDQEDDLDDGQDDNQSDDQDEDRGEDDADEDRGDDNRGDDDRGDDDQGDDGQGDDDQGDDDHGDDDRGDDDRGSDRSGGDDRDSDDRGGDDD